MANLSESSKKNPKKTAQSGAEHPRLSASLDPLLSGPVTQEKASTNSPEKPTSPNKPSAPNSENNPGSAENTDASGKVKLTKQVEQVLANTKGAVSEAAGVISERAGAFAGVSGVTKAKKATSSETRLAHIAYLLFALTPLTGISAVAGLILAYLRRRKTNVEKTVLKGHYDWLIWTFWYGLAASVVSTVLVLVYVGWLLIALTAIWIVWRLVKGWITLYDGEAIASPSAAL